jgi:hypothetical protein
VRRTTRRRPCTKEPFGNYVIDLGKVALTCEGQAKITHHPQDRRQTWAGVGTGAPTRQPDHEPSREKEPMIKSLSATTEASLSPR